MRKIIACLKILAFVLLALLITIVQPVVLLFTKGKAAYVMPRLWHWAVRSVFSITCIVEGTPNQSGQTIFMSNHISYLDIPVLGSLIKASFVAKQEVASWPVFGFLGTLQQTAFLERKKTAIGQAKNSLDTMLAEGRNLIIFPEGTSTDGQEVRPFKSSLFALAMGDNQDQILVQPVTIRVERANGQPIIDQDSRDIYAWHINMDTELHDHLWAFAKTKGAVVRVIFHPPFAATTYDSRKKLAQDCYNAVSSGLHAVTMA